VAQRRVMRAAASTARQSCLELRELQLKAAGRVPEWRDLLLVEGGTGAGRTLAGSLQHHPSTLFARLQIASTGNVATQNENRVWRSGKQSTLSTSPHPRPRRDTYKNQCATLTIQPVQKIGHSIWFPLLIFFKLIDSVSQVFDRRHLPLEECVVVRVCADKKKRISVCFCNARHTQPWSFLYPCTGLDRCLARHLGDATIRQPWTGKSSSCPRTQARTHGLSGQSTHNNEDVSTSASASGSGGWRFESSRPYHLNPAVPTS
jgi:hypothetical protein